jgi:5-methylcytosine-specific restriction endonuclease McrA
MNTLPPPTADQQIEFLAKIQRIFGEGEFTATYKFALLIALADLAVELGRDTGEPLPLDMKQIAERFIALYWPMRKPYQSGLPESQSDILAQNKGIQAAVVNQVMRFNETAAQSFPRAKQTPIWPDVLSKVARVIRDQPVRYLQNIGGNSDPFLFDQPQARKPLILKPGVMFCLRRYYGLIHQLAKSGWIGHIKSNKLNTTVIGMKDDLESFMFGSSRRSLSLIVEILQPLQKDRCFYCDGTLHRDTIEVDHFVAWARYPRDTAHNFVLAHRSCNNAKRDMLAAHRHIERWLDRNISLPRDFARRMQQSGFFTDLNTSTSIAKWAYQQGIENGAHGWVKNNILENLAQDSLNLFPASV